MLLKIAVCPVALLILPGLVNPLPAQQASDEVYAEKIAEYTTDSRFVNEMVDHLPYSEEIPSPLDHFGTIIGAPGILHYTHEIHGYLRALAQASPRVMIREIGKSEENRDMIEVIVSSPGEPPESGNKPALSEPVGRSPQPFRHRGRGAHQQGQANLLRNRGFAFHRDGSTRDADGTGVSPGEWRILPSPNQFAATPFSSSARLQNRMGGTGRWMPFATEPPIGVWIRTWSTGGSMWLTTITVTRWAWL